MLWWRNTGPPNPPHPILTSNLENWSRARLKLRLVLHLILTPALETLSLSLLPLRDRHRPPPLPNPKIAAARLTTHHKRNPRLLTTKYTAAHKHHPAHPLLSCINQCRKRYDRYSNGETSEAPRHKRQEARRPRNGFQPGHLGTMND